MIIKQSRFSSDDYLSLIRIRKGMNVQNLKSPQVKGILLGIIVAFIVTVIGTPLGFALVVGIIFGVIAYVILNDANIVKKFGKKAT